MTNRHGPLRGLGSRILVAAFDGWNDAGEAATSALTALRETGSYEKVWSVDPELYFDYQYTRPAIAYGATGERALTWPGASLWRPVGAGTTEVWLLSGTEPARAWQGFASEIVDQALAADVTGFVTLGGMMSDVPHTRKVPVHASSDNADIRGESGFERSQYEGPVGILSVLSLAMEGVGVPGLSLWASLPHYTAGQGPSPLGALALISAVGELTGTQPSPGSLEAEGRRWEAAVDAAVAEDEELAAYVGELERARDEWDSPDATGDALAREFERYLRRDGDGPQRP